MAGNNLSEYTVTIDGIEHTMQLSPEDAERYGDAAKKKTGGSSSGKASGTSGSGEKSTGASAKTHDPGNKAQ